MIRQKGINQWAAFNNIRQQETPGDITYTVRCRTGRIGVKDSALASNKAAVGYRYDLAHLKQDIATLIISRLFYDAKASSVHLFLEFLIQCVQIYLSTRKLKYATIDLFVI